MNSTNSFPRFCSKPLRRLAISPMTCRTRRGQQISVRHTEGEDEATHLEALRIRVVELRFQRQLEAERDCSLVEELLEARDRRGRRAVRDRRGSRRAVRLDPHLEEFVEHAKAVALIGRERVGRDVVRDGLQDRLEVRLVLCGCEGLVPRLSDPETVRDALSE